MVFMATLSLFFNGCKSVPVAEPVDTLSLVDNDAGLYIYIPVQPNKTFVNKAFAKLTGMNEKDCNTIVSRTDVIAAACATTSGNNQLSIGGNYPLKYLKYGFNEKNGWIEKIFTAGETAYTYYQLKGKPFQAGVMTYGNAVVSTNIEPMIKKYDFVSRETIDSATSDLIPLGFDEAAYKHLTQIQNGEIKFYSTNPSLFLQAFVGKRLDAGITKVAGFLTQVPGKESFGVNIALEIENPKAMKATIAAIKIAMFPVTAKIQQTGSKTIVISDITMSWNKIIGLISL